MNPSLGTLELGRRDLEGCHFQGTKSIRQKMWEHSVIICAVSIKTWLVVVEANGSTEEQGWKPVLESGHSPVVVPVCSDPVTLPLFFIRLCPLQKEAGSLLLIPEKF